MENNKNNGPISFLDLPESTLDLILKYLSPTELCTMSEVCVPLKGKCQSDHFWENQIKRKWGRVIGDAVYEEWKWHIRIAKQGNLLNQHTNQTGSMGSFTGVWPNLYLGSYLEDCKVLKGQRSNNFFMSLYFSLESGRLWFPAQVYKGVMVCSASLVSYNSQSNTFEARTQSGGWKYLGKNIEWDMVRVYPVDSSPFVMHVSDCLDNLKPDDHIEIQWKADIHCPYDWWYAVIGHLDACNQNYCQCHCSDVLIVEFRQYREGSNMRRTRLSRKNTAEQGYLIGGYYGGIRKLENEDEIEKWKTLISGQVQMAPVLYMPPVAAQMLIL